MNRPLMRAGYCLLLAGYFAFGAVVALIFALAVLVRPGLTNCLVEAAIQYFKNDATLLLHKTEHSYWLRWTHFSFSNNGGVTWWDVHPPRTVRRFSFPIVFSPVWRQFRLGRGDGRGHNE